MFLQQRSLRSSFLNKSTSIENYFALMKDFYLFSPRGRRYRAYLECSSGNYDDVFSRRLLALRSSLPARCISFHSCYYCFSSFDPPASYLGSSGSAQLSHSSSSPTCRRLLPYLARCSYTAIRPDPPASSVSCSFSHVSPHTLLAVLFTTTTLIHFI